MSQAAVPPRAIAAPRAVTPSSNDRAKPERETWSMEMHRRSAADSERVRKSFMRVPPRQRPSERR